MTWGTYYFFYECPQCGKKYRYELEGSADEEFGFCPECHVMGTFVGETKDNQQGEDMFAYYEFVKTGGSRATRGSPLFQPPPGRNDP